MRDPHHEDHLVGLELQAVELTEQERRAELQGDTAEAARVQHELEGVYADMARTAEHLVADGTHVTVAAQSSAGLVEGAGEVGDQVVG
jgi:hypothetical protein